MSKEINEAIEVMNLESLISGGSDNVIPITIKYMGQEFSANIRPINALENNEVTQKFLNKKESIIVNTVKKCLLKDEGKTNYKIEEIAMLRDGVVEAIYNKIQEVSGMEQENLDSDQVDLVRRIMGF